MVVNGDFETHGFFASLKTECDRWTSFRVFKFGWVHFCWWIPVITKLADECPLFLYKPRSFFPNFLGDAASQFHHSRNSCKRWSGKRSVREVASPDNTHTGNRHFFDDNFMIIMIIMKPSIIINSIYHQKLDQWWNLSKLVMDLHPEIHVKHLMRSEKAFGQRWKIASTCHDTKKVPQNDR